MEVGDPRPLLTMFPPYISNFSRCLPAKKRWQPNSPSHACNTKDVTVAGDVRVALATLAENAKPNAMATSPSALSVVP
jgi:hypothetical protein